ncbi:DNA replication and repair protein RecF [Bacillus licheniformis]|uniref:AAA family ATPase n=1 Tax=Bacillus licheniformis TaxID=1402 RepID=UPI0011A44BE8|nr:AAA family ATPase [Bacillus licheniformis]TWL65752.1 DNA replication and repair protein RecF [Bacillus licheniformis]
MLISSFINGYKSYNKAYFVPITIGLHDKYTVYIGNNGVGKSGILEAIDVFFNNREWNVYKGAKKDDVYISPVFLINKKEFNARFENHNRFNRAEINEFQKTIADLTKISDYIWGNLDGIVRGSSRREHIDKFFEMKRKLEDRYKEDYYLLVIGVKSNGKTTLNPFQGYLGKLIEESEKRMDKIRKMILLHYSYVYISVEQRANDILKIEAEQMQKLMSRDVLELVDKIIEQPLNIEGRNINFLSYINQNLDKFMDEINEKIKCIDTRYDYGVSANYKKRLTRTDLRDKILEAYFLKKSLRHNQREISKLSSGEQRKALVDIAYAFLSNFNQKEKEIVLAIDEPEVSLNVANCFAQFTRIEDLANKFNSQIIITTHWYGFLPITTKGQLIHLEKSIDNLKINQYSFFNYLDNQRSFPEDVELKSMFDLATSILSYIKTNETHSNWIICEGGDDKIYLDTILPENKEYRILPVGGCGNVVKLFNLLLNPLLIDKKERKEFKGKILCIIDTDETKMNYKFENLKDMPIFLRRLQVFKSNNEEVIKLLDVAKQGTIYEKTEIEDCLDPQIYYNSIKTVILSSQDSNIIDLFNNFELNREKKFSKISGDDSLLLPNGNEAYRRKNELVSFLEKPEIKMLVAKEYSQESQSTNITHALAIEIIDYFEESMITVS